MFAYTCFPEFSTGRERAGTYDRRPKHVFSFLPSESTHFLSYAFTRFSRETGAQSSIGRFEFTSHAAIFRAHLCSVPLNGFGRFENKNINSAGHKVSLISKAKTFYRIRHCAVAFLASLTLLMAGLWMVILMVMEYNRRNDDIKNCDGWLNARRQTSRSLMMFYTNEYPGVTRPRPVSLVVARVTRQWFFLS